MTLVYSQNNESSFISMNSASLLKPSLPIKNDSSFILLILRIISRSRRTKLTNKDAPDQVRGV